jgi:Cu/Ag efflux protein CusF
MKSTRMIIAAVAALTVAAPASALAAPSHGAAAATISKSEREVRIVGRVTKLTRHSITIKNATRTVTFHRRPGHPLLHGIRVGTRVEAEGRRINGRLTLVSIHRED